MISSIDFLPHAFRTPVDLASLSQRYLFHTDPLSWFVFSYEAFSSDLRMSLMIERVLTEGLTHCPSCASFESTENESSTLKNWEIHECPVICPGLQIFFPLGIICTRIIFHVFANVVNILLQ